ncbi:MAG: hypothetical protein IPL61_00930 [Myxococcales bacterium]|nr:hypothetical protein [Myxococcales bacterium]
MGSITSDGPVAEQDDDRTADGDERTLDRRGRPSLGAALAEHVIALVLERTNARRPACQLAARTPAVAATVTARRVDLGAGALTMEALYEVAARAVTAFCDHDCLVVVRPGDGPTFLFPLPTARDDDGTEADEVVALCRQLDDEQARQRAVAIAERFRADVSRAPALRQLLVEVRLGEGTIVGAPTRAGRLLPAAVWRPT